MRELKTLMELEDLKRSLIYRDILEEIARPLKDIEVVRGPLQGFYDYLKERNSLELAEIGLKLNKYVDKRNRFDGVIINFKGFPLTQYMVRQGTMFCLYLLRKRGIYKDNKRSWQQFKTHVSNCCQSN